MKWIIFFNIISIQNIHGTTYWFKAVLSCVQRVKYIN